MEEHQVVDFVLRFYDQDIKNVMHYTKPDSGNPEGKLFVKTTITFTPKKISPNFPKVAKAKGEWRYDHHYRDYHNPKEYHDEFYDMIYLRDDDMPILKFISGFIHFDNYLEKIVKQEYFRVKEKYF